MEQLNVLELRNNLYQILDRLEKTGKPILISKGKRIRAVLITPVDFDRHFLHIKAHEEKQCFPNNVKSLRRKSKEKISSIHVLRKLRRNGL